MKHKILTIKATTEDSFDVPMGSQLIDSSIGDLGIWFLTYIVPDYGNAIPPNRPSDLL